MPLAIATMTLARSEQEQDRLVRSLAALGALSLPIFLTDGGSLPSFQQWLTTAPNVHLTEPVRGLVPQVRRSLAAAAHIAPAVLYTEPDKLEFFLTDLPSIVAHHCTAAQPADLIVFSRTDSAFRTFPQGQQIPERSFNEIAAHLLHTAPEDLLYGPLCLKSDLSRELDTIPDDAGWGWRILLYVRTLLSGRRVEYLSGPYDCPPEQRTETDRASSLYRVQQLTQNLTALQNALR